MRGEHIREDEKIKRRKTLHFILGNSGMSRWTKLILSMASARTSFTRMQEQNQNRITDMTEIAESDLYLYNIAIIRSPAYPIQIPRKHSFVIQPYLSK